MWYSWIIQTKWVEMAAWELNRIYSIYEIQREANRDHHSSMFQIWDEIKAPKETQYHEELEDLVPKESLTLVLMSVQVLAGVCFSFDRIMNNDTDYFALQETIPRVQVRMLKKMPLEIRVFRSERKYFDAGCLWLVIHDSFVILLAPHNPHVSLAVHCSAGAEVTELTRSASKLFSRK